MKKETKVAENVLFRGEKLCLIIMVLPGLF